MEIGDDWNFGELSTLIGCSEVASGSTGAMGVDSWLKLCDRPVLRSGGTPGEVLSPNIGLAESLSSDGVSPFLSLFDPLSFSSRVASSGEPESKRSSLFSIPNGRMIPQRGGQLKYFFPPNSPE